MFSLTPYYRRAVGYDPFRELDRIERRLLGASLPDFRMDLREEENDFVMEAELPGFKRAEISIEVEGGYMTVRAEREQKEGSVEEGRYLRNERFSGVLERTFTLAGVDADGISAAYQDGVLTVRMPKKKSELPKKRTLEIQ
jgi:HSP20 family protein